MSTCPSKFQAMKRYPNDGGASARFGPSDYAPQCWQRRVRAKAKFTIAALESSEPVLWTRRSRSHLRERGRPNRFEIHPDHPRRPHMTKVLVLYYSSFGHIEAMANAVAEGAREAGASVDIKRVPELVPPEVAKASHFSSINPLRLPRSRTSPITTRSSWAPAPGSAACRRRWRISSTRAAACG
jgi:hypothetical protein